VRRQNSPELIAMRIIIIIIIGMPANKMSHDADADPVCPVSSGGLERINTKYGCIK
jgi:hypothetical protein